jgi:hypothetical protein
MAASEQPGEAHAADAGPAAEREPPIVRVSAELVAGMPALSRTDMSLIVSVGVPEGVGEASLVLVPLVEWQLVETKDDLDEEDYEDDLPGRDGAVIRIVSYENVGFLIRDMCEDFARVTDHLARMSSAELAPPAALVTSVSAYLDEAIESLAACRRKLDRIGGGPASEV